MTIKKYAFRTAAAVFVSALALTGCASNGGNTEGGNAAAKGGDLQIAWNAQPATLDPVATTSTATRDIVNNVFESLFALDAAAVPQPMLAESYEANDDFTEFTFNLRKGVKFHNGDEMKANDVVASFNRWIADSAVGQADFADAVVAAVDDYTVTVTVPESFYTLVSATLPANQGLIIVPEESLVTLNETGMAEDALIGTGPYKFVEWKKDQQIVLERFDDYSSVDMESSGYAGEKNAYLDTLTFQIVPDGTTRANGLQAGQYDFASSLPTDNFAALEASGLVLSPELIYQFFFVPNKAAGFFSSNEARQALNYAVDPTQGLAAAYGDEQFYDLNGAISNKDQSAYYSDFGIDGRYDAKDSAKAKKLFEEAGYDGSPVRVLTTRDYADSYNASVVLEQQLEEAGLNVELVVTDQATLLTTRGEADTWDIFPTGLGFGAPESMLPLKSSWAGATDSPEITAALSAVKTSTSDEDLFTAREGVQKAFYDYAPALKLGDGAALNGYSSALSGYEYMYGPIFFNVAKSN